MPQEPDDKPNADNDREQEYVRGGKGRKDEVGHSGIYPASAHNAPAGAEIRGQGELGHPNRTRPVGSPDETSNSPIRPTD
jgi:hypothetical protein